MSQPQSQPQQQSLATLGASAPASQALTGPVTTATGTAVGNANFCAGPGLSNGFGATDFRSPPAGWDQAFGHTPSLQPQVGPDMYVHPHPRWHAQTRCDCVSALLV